MVAGLLIAGAENERYITRLTLSGRWASDCLVVSMLICMAGFCPVYSFSLFLPTIIRNMGYSANNAQLMSVPPYVFACLFTLGASALADRYRQRGVFLLGFQSVAVLGLVLLAVSADPTIQYTGMVLAAIGK